MIEAWRKRYKIIAEKVYKEKKCRVSWFVILENTSGVIHSNESVSVEDVKSVVNKELMGPGRVLGCRAMHVKIKNIHGLNAPRDLVYTATKRKTNFSMHQLFYSYFIIAEQINGLVSI